MTALFIGFVFFCITLILMHMIFDKYQDNTKCKQIWFDACTIVMIICSFITVFCMVHYCSNNINNF